MLCMARFLGEMQRGTRPFGFSLNRGGPPVARLGARVWKLHQLVINAGIRDPGYVEAAPQQKRVPNNFSLLFNSITLQRPARLDCIVIAAEGMAAEQQVPFPALLGLPDMCHLMDEQPLAGHGRTGKVVAINVTTGVKMQMAARGHRNFTRL